MILEGSGKSSSPLPRCRTIGAYDIVHDVHGRMLLAGINLELDAGEIACIVGSAGSGKSLLLSILAGFTRPLVGEVYLGESSDHRIDLAGDGTGRIGYSPQHPWLDERLEVWQWLEYAAARSGLPPQTPWRSPDPLERLGISHLRERQIADLSTSEQRLVDFTSLLPAKPRVYLLDAMFDGLDKDRVQRVAEILRQEASRGKGILLTTTTRDNDVLGLCTRVLCLHEGRLTEESR